jgi:ribonucleoside-triphosphate reductase
MSHVFGSYSQGVIITKKDLQAENALNRDLILLDDILTGGFSVKLDTTSLDLEDSVDLLSRSVDLVSYFNVLDRQVICNVCGSRILNNGTCTICRSNNELTLS